MRATARLLLVLACAFVCAATAAVPEPDGYWTGPPGGSVPAGIRGGRVIQPRALAQLLARGDAVVLDVASEPKRPQGLGSEVLWRPPPHEGIPHSYWVPGLGTAPMSAEAEMHFRELLARLTDGNRGRPVVTYCHPRCWLSWNAAKRVLSFGYRNVYWFAEGIEGWRAGGHPTAIITRPER